MHDPPPVEQAPPSTLFVAPMVTAHLVTEGSGTVYAVTGNVTTIGRGDTNKVVIPEKSISRNHCRIERIPTGYQLVDRESTNGTFVNGHRVTRTTLHAGDEIRMGAISLRFETSSE